MCRLVVYRGHTSISLADLLIAPSHSIIAQSHACRERLGDGGPLSAQLNADGFGIGWYAPPAEGAGRKRRRPEEELQTAQAGLFTSICPAWNDPNLGRICNKVSSRLVFAHVRAASIGSAVHEFNCHPFACQRYMFMHNGHIAAFATKMRRRFLDHSSDRVLSSIRGTTDSEHLFAVLLTEIEKEATKLLKAGYRPASGYGAGIADAGAIDPLGVELPPETLQACMLRAIWLVGKWRHEAGIEGSSLLNLCLTDGETVLATRVVVGVGKPASLYYTSGTAWAPRRDAAPAGTAPATGVSGSLHMAANGGGIDFTMVQTDRREHAVIVASERLTACQEDWLPVPRDTMLVVHPSMAVLKLPVPQYVPEAAAQTAGGAAGPTVVAEGLVTCVSEPVGDPGHRYAAVSSSTGTPGSGSPPLLSSTTNGAAAGRGRDPAASLQQLLASPLSASKVITTTSSSSNSREEGAHRSPVLGAIPPLALGSVAPTAAPEAVAAPPSLLYRADLQPGGTAMARSSGRAAAVTAPPAPLPPYMHQQQHELSNDRSYMLLAGPPPAKRPRGASDEKGGAGAAGATLASPLPPASSAAALDVRAPPSLVAETPVDTARVQMACQGRSFFGATLSAWGGAADCCGAGLGPAEDSGQSEDQATVLVVEGAAALAGQ